MEYFLGLEDGLIKGWIMNINSGDWFVRRKRFNFQKFSANGVDFNLIPLTDELGLDVMACTTSAGMIDLAASLGMSIGRDRIVDDAEFAADMDDFWLDDDINTGTEPSIREKVGVEVLSISDLTDALNEVIEKERIVNEQYIVDNGGESLDDLDVNTLRNEQVV